MLWLVFPDNGCNGGEGGVQVKGGGGGERKIVGQAQCDKPGMGGGGWEGYGPSS